jgi:hypothetical protein
VISSLLKQHEQSFVKPETLTGRLKYLSLSKPIQSSFHCWDKPEDVIPMIGDWEHSLIYMASQVHAKYLEQKNGTSTEKYTYNIGPYVHSMYQLTIDYSLENKVAVQLDYDPLKNTEAKFILLRKSCYF